MSVSPGISMCTVPKAIRDNYVNKQCLVVTSASHYPTKIKPRSKEGSHIQCMPHLWAFWRRFPPRKTSCGGLTPYVPAYISPKLSQHSKSKLSDLSHSPDKDSAEWKWESESSLLLWSELPPAARRPALAKIQTPKRSWSQKWIIDPQHVQGLGWIFKMIWSQPLLPRAGHLLLNQVAQGFIQPGF